MAATASTLDRDSVIRELNEIIHLDFDAIAAYESAIEKLHNESFRDRLQAFKLDHERHTTNLGEQVRKLGGKPASSGDFKKVLTKGRVLLAGLGSDQSILEAMRANENQTNASYEQAIQRLSGEPALIETLRRNLEDERRHRQWLISTLDGLT